ncbi:L,D-transpeptidase family protein [Streptomyces sp. NPDC059786]|uniref:L,D-transpeptidase family protein n=1 Tax=Streptomyces sp. NPDC059786 TaxID=3346946 RepID=UPI003658FB98
MRTKGMRRRIAAALVALAAVTVTGCKAEAGGGQNGQSKQPWLRIDVTSTPGGKQQQGGPGGDDGKDGGDGAGGTTASAAPSSGAKVLWSAGDEGLDVREVQARLVQLQWLFHGPSGTYDEATVAAVAGFQGKRGLPRTGKTDSVTWQRLKGMTHEPTKWELYAFGGQPAAAPDPRCLTGRVLCISKTSRTLRWMIDGRTVSTMEVRFGSQPTPTREGVFTVYYKSRHHVSTLYDSPMPYAMFFSGGQAVHFSQDFAARGYAGGSHGCVNVRDEVKIASLYAQVRYGDKVVVYW